MTAATLSPHPAAQPMPVARSAASVLARPTLQVLAGLGALVLALHASTLWWVGGELRHGQIKPDNAPIYGKLLTAQAMPTGGSNAAGQMPAPPVLAPSKAVVAIAEPAKPPAKKASAEEQEQVTVTPLVVPPPVVDTPSVAEITEVKLPVVAAAKDNTATQTVAANTVVDVERALNAVLNAEPRAATQTPSGVASSAVKAFGVSGGNTSANLWPKSTKVTYVGTGYLNGDLHGSGHFEWINSDGRYKLFLTSNFLVTGEFRSSGQIANAWLRPERYEEQRSGKAPRATNFDYQKGKVSFSAVTDVLDLPPGTQDAATIIMQITGVLMSSGGKLNVGQRFGYPVARLNGLRQWDFEVIGLETLSTPLGPLQSYHIKRVAAELVERDVSIELWLSPQLQGLPVRIVLKPNKDTTIQLDVAKAEQ